MEIQAQPSVEVSATYKFKPYDFPQGADFSTVQRLMRLNSLGSLYQFTKTALRRDRLTNTLHGPICDQLESEYLKDVIEMPRDHFKSTIGSEALPMWRVLPFNNQDADAFHQMGEPDEFIRFMRQIHRPEGRNLLVSENLTNASKLGSKINYHFMSNAVYRSLFPETLPDTSCTWNYNSMHIKPPTNVTNSELGGHGEGTFDFIGVGGALQSRHYGGGGIIVQDDLVGKAAIESQVIMEKTIDYHKLIVGAFEDTESDQQCPELIIGNRWSYIDLNSHIQENEPWFKHTRHSALGGCCPLHRQDEPILPKIFSFEKLMELKKRLGVYYFSCQYLNDPTPPDDADFRVENLNYYNFSYKNEKFFGPQLPDYINPLDCVIQHSVHAGRVLADLPVRRLNICLVSDPNHSGNSGLGRCRHSIVVLGLSDSGDNYLLDCWAEGCGYEQYIATIYQMCDHWGLKRFGLETVAAQKYLKHHIEQRNILENRNLKIIELKGEVEGPDGQKTRKKELRIRNVLAPIFESGHFYTLQRFQKFHDEYIRFPNGSYVDILDAMAYAPQLLRMPRNSMSALTAMQANHAASLKFGQPYSAPIN